MLRRGRTWHELDPAEQATIALAGTLQVALQAAALLDMRGRPDVELNGSKRMWVVLSFVNFLGPIAYFAIGRRRAPGAGVGGAR